MLSTRLASILLVQLLALQFGWIRCSVCNDGDYTNDPTDCNAFFQCSFGTMIRRNCPPFLHFNRFNNVCDFPERANCVVDEATTQSPTLPPTLPPPTTGPPTVTTTTTGPPTVTTTTTGPPTIITTTTGPPTVIPTATGNPTAPTTITPFPSVPTDPITSPPDATFPPWPTTMQPESCPIVDGPYVVHLAHPNCSMFYKCVHGIPHEMICPDNQHWSIESERCDFVSESNCHNFLAPEQPGARPPNYW